MVDIQNHKGQPCLYAQILCQEGFCSECAVCLKRISENSLLDNLPRIAGVDSEIAKLVNSAK